MKILISAGPTRERIDAVRFLSNRSTGKMGFALAGAAADAGFETVLVAGPVHLPTPAGVRRIDVESAAEMADAVAAKIAGVAQLIGVNANGVAHRNVGHGLADLFDLPGKFMAEHRTRRSGGCALVTVKNVHVGAADAAGAHADQYVVIAHLGLGNVLNAKILFSVKNSSFHDVLLIIYKQFLYDFDKNRPF
jgi:hypothetical protein